MFLKDRDAITRQSKSGGVEVLVKVSPYDVQGDDLKHAGTGHDRAHRPEHHLRVQRPGPQEVRTTHHREPAHRGISPAAGRHSGRRALLGPADQLGHLRRGHYHGQFYRERGRGPGRHLERREPARPAAIGGRAPARHATRRLNKLVVGRSRKRERANTRKTPHLFSVHSAASHFTGSYSRTTRVTVSAH